MFKLSINNIGFTNLPTASPVACCYEQFYKFLLFWNTLQWEAKKLDRAFAWYCTATNITRVLVGFRDRVIHSREKQHIFNRIWMSPLSLSCLVKRSKEQALVCCLILKRGTLAPCVTFCKGTIIWSMSAFSNFEERRRLKTFAVSNQTSNNSIKKTNPLWTVNYLSPMTTNNTKGNSP